MKFSRNSAGTWKSLLFLSGATALFLFFLFRDSKNSPPEQKSIDHPNQALNVRSKLKLNGPYASTAPINGAPARMSLSDMEMRSKRGDASAACHVAIIYEKCLLLLRQYDDVVAMIESKNQGAAGYFEALSSRSDYCAGISINSNDAVDKWKDAAQKGNLNAMKGYVSGSALLGISDTVKYRTAFQEYSQLAEGFAWKLADQGDVNAVLALAHAYESGPTPAGPKLSQVVKKDPTKALAIFYYLEDVPSRTPMHSIAENRVRDLALTSIKAMESSLSAASIRASAIMAGDLQHRWTKPLNYEKLFMSTLEDGTLSSAQAEDCDDQENQH
ncbi:hypothetical protein [Xanthomonas hortorum]|uniref:hypothetical protein n=1 Tax=Xanthomonas hortorum TaxID=56454 RepID=UPI00293690C3|nr:hypothetical protein [Xanthomonas hortorum]MDV2453208.1 hypothetical protein [Xanthomonas hortorum NBC5720]